MNAINYMPREKGGRGLRFLEHSYKLSKIKLSIKLVGDTDPRMKIVREYHEKIEHLKSFSIFKDAETYSSEAGMELAINEKILSIIDNDTGETISEHYQRD